MFEKLEQFIGNHLLITLTLASVALIIILGKGRSRNHPTLRTHLSDDDRDEALLRSMQKNRHPYSGAEGGGAMPPTKPAA